MQTMIQPETVQNGHSTEPEQDSESGTGQAPASSTGQVLLDALRSNLNLLGELAMRYQVEIKPERPENPPSIIQPGDVNKILGPEMSGLAQEQLRVLLLDIKNNIVGQRVIYQGTVSAPRHAA